MSRNKHKGEITLGEGNVILCGTAEVGCLRFTPGSGEWKIIGIDGIILGYVKPRMLPPEHLITEYLAGDRRFDSLQDAIRHVLRSREKDVAPQRAHKYNAQRTTVDGITFDSKREAGRYSYLIALERSGWITELKTQVPFTLNVNFCHVCKYIADFMYKDRSGALVVEDAKGMKTPVYRLKKKLMKACLGINIQEV